MTPYHDDKIVEQPVFYEEMMIYAHPDHELLKKKDIETQDIATLSYGCWETGIVSEIKW